MNRFLMSAAAGLLALTLAGPAWAGGHGHSHSFAPTHYTTSSGSFRNFTPNHSSLQRYGTKFSHGYYFNKSNFYWTSRYWSSRYGCYCYWCPYASCYYYWCAPQSCYYPISYIVYAPPVVTVTPPVVTVTPPAVTVTPGTVGVTPGIAGGPGGPVGPGGGMPPAVP